MVVNADKSGVDSTSENDTRITSLGYFIRKYKIDELPNKPLSDNKISALLKEDGINVARRTIAKYRETMTIPPSNERKRF